MSANTLRVSLGENRHGSTSPDIGAKACVPNVCRLGKTRPNSSTLSKNKDRSKTLIQRTLRERSASRATLAKEGKNGFVIRWPPVRSRRVAPSKLIEINGLLVNLQIDIAVDVPRVGTQTGTQKFGCGRAGATKLL